MKTRLIFLLAILISLASAKGAEIRAVLDIAPSLAELGPGWTTNSIVALLDPLTPPLGLASRKQPEPKRATNLLRTARMTKGQMGWARLEYGHGDMILNKGAYFVSIQRWGNTNALDKVWQDWQSRPDFTPWRALAIGDACSWTEDAKFHGLTFRRGLFHVVVTCGSHSDHSGLLRLAEVLDAKITGRPIPKVEEPAKTEEPAKELRLPNNEPARENIR